MKTASPDKGRRFETCGRSSAAVQTFLGCLVATGCFLVPTICPAGGSAAELTSRALRVDSFSQGLITADANGRPWIYEQGSEFVYRTNGTCMAAGQRLDCMWHGTSVSYEAQSEVTILQCVSKSVDAVANVNTMKHLGNASERNWTLELRGKRGALVHPQYVHLGHSAGFSDSTVCSLDGVEVLRWEFKVRAPATSLGALPRSMGRVGPDLAQTS